jgi:hypothetical protein
MENGPTRIATHGPTVSAATGYRVSVMLAALQVSARRGTPEEVRNLVNVFRAGIVILEDIAEGDMDVPVKAHETIAAVSATSPKSNSSRHSDLWSVL